MKTKLSTKEERKEYLDGLINNYKNVELIMIENQKILKVLLENDHIDEIVNVLAKTSDRLNNVIIYHNNQIMRLIDAGATAISFENK